MEGYHQYCEEGPVYNSFYSSSVLLHPPRSGHRFQFLKILKHILHSFTDTMQGVAVLIFGVLPTDDFIQLIKRAGEKSKDFLF